jgi:hypothetical protein
VTLLRKRLTYANVMSSIAVFIAIGGASYASFKLPKNSVGPKQLRKNSVTKPKIRKKSISTPKIVNGAVNSAKVADGSLTGTDVQAGSLTGAQVNASTLGTVPNASHADKASSADDASKLGGVAPVPPAIPITLLNGWQPYGGGYDQPAYWQDALGEVHLKGSVAQPIAGSDVIFVLPANMRPARSTNWPATLDSAHFGTIEIEANGDVRARTFSAEQATQSHLFTSMEGVSFRPSDP